VPQTRRTSRDAALVELQRLHAAILASRAQRGASPDGGPAVASPSSESPSPEALAAQALTRRLQASADVPADEPIEPETRSRRGWWLALAAAVIVGGAWMAMTMTQRPEVVTEAAPPGPKTAAPDPSPVAPTPAAAPAAAVTPARPIRVTLATIRPVWLRVTVDGVRALEREVPAGETLSFDGDRAVLVRSGDAGGVRASMNGVDRGPLGKDGWPLTVSITPDGIAPLTPTRPEL
jgi:cytoskeleton protein RodZ